MFGFLPILLRAGRSTAGLLVCCCTLWCMAQCLSMGEITKGSYAKSAKGSTGNLPSHQVCVWSLYFKHLLLIYLDAPLSTTLNFYLYLPDARGLIRWMLMVNPDRRATVEDIANHWWVNWGWKTSVCDCQTQQENSSPMLARFIDWQSRTETQPSKLACPDSGVNTSGTISTRRLRRSSKENECGIRAVLEEKPAMKRPKSILKTRASTGDQRSQSLCEAELRRSICYREVEPTSSPEREEAAGGSPAKMMPSLPMKGILKNNHQRESGYYSSPERSESSELLESTVAPPPNGSPPKRVPGRKGILKRNGKYSSHVTPTLDSNLPQSQSRTSTILREEIGIPSIAVDWPPSSPKPNIRGSLSAEDLLQMAGFRGLQTATPLHGSKNTRSPPGSPGDNGSFSLLGDLDDVTQVYQQALNISNHLS